ncbi:hypothetical protein INR49_009578 [Caranx melampygus]|nr:hypothetical protein INR49_009578 [Caranx melampygus]
MLLQQDGGASRRPRPGGWVGGLLRSVWPEPPGEFKWTFAAAEGLVKNLKILCQPSQQENLGLPASQTAAGPHL